MGVKVAIVGAGSTYTPELVEGFIRRADRFPVDELALLDVDPSRLEVVGGLARRMLDRAGFGGRTVLTGDRDEAIDGAAFVIVQLRVGGQAARLLDETIPLRFGCIGQETTGAGGFAKALRTVPVVLELAELAGRRGAPGCWFIDFTNPTGLVTQALLDREVRAIGLCNVAIGFQRRFAERFGVEPERVELEHVGLNHLSWVRAVKVDGVDRLPELLENDLAQLSADAEVPPELLRALGAIPSYYLRYYYRTREMFERQTHGTTRAEEVAQIEHDLLELYRDPDLAEKPQLLERRGGAFYSEAAAQLVASLASGTGDVQVVNARNAGAIPNLARRRRRRGRREGRHRRRAPDPGRAARPGHARARAARQGLRAADDRGRDDRGPFDGAPGAAREPARPRRRRGHGPARRDPRREPRASAALRG